MQTAGTDPSWEPYGVRGDMMVLTRDRGLSPIAGVRDDDLIWDGTEFVHHGGAVFLGWGQAIWHGGLVGTRGVHVYMQGRSLPMPLWLAAHKMARHAEDGKTAAAKAPEEDLKRLARCRAAIYTIMDCGPRHRFACSGSLVRNHTTA